MWGERKKIRLGRGVKCEVEHSRRVTAEDTEMASGNALEYLESVFRSGEAQLMRSGHSRGGTGRVQA
jgi:hypothetical protein